MGSISVTCPTDLVTNFCLRPRDSCGRLRATNKHTFWINTWKDLVKESYLSYIKIFPSTRNFCHGGSKANGYIVLIEN